MGQVNGIRNKMESIEAKKNELLDEDLQGECLEIIYQVKAARNALKKFGEAYLQMHIEECIHKKTPQKEILRNMQEALKASVEM